MRADGPVRTAHRVVAVVVTHERLALLRQALSALGEQTRPPDAVVVVDNASTDGTADAVAAEHPGVELVRLRRNTGGAGGFAVGLQHAIERCGADLVWLMDDDTVPAPTALQALLTAWATRPGGPPALVASRVRWTDGRDHPMNTPRRAPFATRSARAAAARVGCLPIRSASFVSVLVEAAAVRRVGLPVADYFLWNDDFEFTCRLLRGRPGLWCPDSVVEHRTRTFGASDADPGPRFYYEVRNKVWLFTRSPGLRPVERAMYAGSSLVRWGRTARASRDRAALCRAAVRGLR
ncbi:MAG TPA: glycosyltransferase family 2 protein, partial [Cryptosporangiaceae bacterium]|nr:glycosyltransferase family 2 protein [Cryptosporangiaceae bacterium]